MELAFVLGATLVLGLEVIARVGQSFLALVTTLVLPR